MTERDERGAASLELVLVVPALVLMLGLMIAGGRLWFAQSAVTDAAAASARAASLARTADRAAADGRTAARSSLATGGVVCASESITIDTSAFAVPPGVPATVRSTLTCRVPFGDILLPGLPGSVLITKTGAAALDTYRGRS